jgi:hypothetical protein
MEVSPDAGTRVLSLAVVCGPFSIPLSSENPGLAVMIPLRRQL